MTAFTFRMPSGIPGDINRGQHATVEAALLDTTDYPTVYGVPVKIVSGKVLHIKSGDAATVVYGMYARPYPTQSGTDPLGTDTPPTSGIVNIMVRGYMSVKVNTWSGAAVPAKGGAVYVRKTAAGSGSANLMGGIEADADSGNCVAIARTYFMGTADSQGMCEIGFNI